MGASSRGGHHFAGQPTHLNGLEVVVGHIYGVTDETLGVNPNNSEGPWCGGGRLGRNPRRMIFPSRAPGVIEPADSINDSENPQYLYYAYKWASGSDARWCGVGGWGWSMKLGPIKRWVNWCVPCWIIFAAIASISLSSDR